MAVVTQNMPLQNMALKCGDDRKEDQSKSAWLQFLKSVMTFKGDLTSLTAPPFLLAPTSIIEYSAYWAEHPKLFVAPALEDDAELRLGLFASQVAGIFLTRHVVALPPIATADVDRLVAAETGGDPALAASESLTPTQKRAAIRAATALVRLLDVLDPSGEVRGLTLSYLTQPAATDAHEDFADFPME